MRFNSLVTRLVWAVVATGALTLASVTAAPAASGPSVNWRIWRFFRALGASNRKVW